MLQPLAKTPGAVQKKGVSGRTSKEGRRADGPSEGEGLRKAAMRSESGVPQSSGLHLVTACDAHNRQLVSRLQQRFHLQSMCLLEETPARFVGLQEQLALQTSLGVASLFLIPFVFLALVGLMKTPHWSTNLRILDFLEESLLRYCWIGVRHQWSI